MGEEIRRRLEASFDAEAEAPSDPKTRELLAQIKEIANFSLSSWYEDRFAFSVFRSAINTLLSRREPSGEVNPETIDKLRATYG